MIQVCLVAFELITSTAFLISSPSLLKGIIFQHDVNTSSSYPIEDSVVENKEFNIWGLPKRDMQKDTLNHKSEDKGEEVDIIKDIEAYFQSEKPFLRENLPLLSLVV